MSAHQQVIEPEAHGRPHPGDNVYWTMLVMLAVFTVIEVLIYYHISSLATRIIVLSAILLIKFIAQVGWFTHLRYDDRRLLFVFGGCFSVAFLVVASTIWMMVYDGMWIGRHYP